MMQRASYASSACSASGVAGDAPRGHERAVRTVRWNAWSVNERASCAPHPARDAPCPMRQTMLDRSARASCERWRVQSRAAAARPMARSRRESVVPQTAISDAPVARRQRPSAAPRRGMTLRNRSSGRRGAGCVASRSSGQERLLAYVQRAPHWNGTADADAVGYSQRERERLSMSAAASDRQEPAVGRYSADPL